VLFVIKIIIIIIIIINKVDGIAKAEKRQTICSLRLFHKKRSEMNIEAETRHCSFVENGDK
jgi:hypothetical protein